MKLNYHFFFEKEINPVFEEIENDGKPYRILEALKMLKRRL
ncbi:MAG TPA: hypothetical protein VJB08_04650 [Candidatus Nanoarchaeia archaeon]|nr:hypothetical protein [Candidatus Nanoarchaeia archaeon]